MADCAGLRAGPPPVAGSTTTELRMVPQATSHADARSRSNQRKVRSMRVSIASRAAFFMGGASSTGSSPQPHPPHQKKTQYRQHAPADPFDVPVQRALGALAEQPDQQ